ncbi:hypothetical protein RchiOBHm_Chr1g0380641 [Rosa chinensis]|uniref:Uncharacterized protein n=1 Tax=Rosa chinensis TaxID=74649 RepID=A0A2P6SNX7_ROSCH|nr:hypothetical protein RchiOBHm_Chr1g0380641 [Rosa chinensis]
MELSSWPVVGLGFFAGVLGWASIRRALEVSRKSGFLGGKFHNLLSHSIAAKTIEREINYQERSREREINKVCFFALHEEIEREIGGKF